LIAARRESALDLNQLKSWMRGDILVDRLKISRLDGR